MRTAEKMGGCFPELDCSFYLFPLLLQLLTQGRRSPPGRVRMASDQEFTGRDEDGLGLALGPHMRRRLPRQEFERHRRARIYEGAYAEIQTTIKGCWLGWVCSPRRATSSLLQIS